jgi:hypothetical protein
MYTTIHTYTLLPGTKERFIQDVQERLVPLFDHVPGFHTVSLVESGDHNVTSICTYHTFADAKAAARLVGDCLSQISVSCMQGEAKRAAGQERVYSESTRLPLASQEKLLQGSFSAG